MRWDFRYKSDMSWCTENQLIFTPQSETFIMAQFEFLKAPIKSEKDKKDYRLIKLQNGLKALLIHTPASETEEENENLSACSLTVGVGSYDEPQNIGGLAHFLEHMLFMGSEKYPGEGEYNQFITANGGGNNAETCNEHTVYFFDVADNALSESLDRFAQQFISPLLLRNALQREREAVDSEFQMAMVDDSLRIELFVKALMDSDHPASFFDYGNLQSLKHDITDDELYSAVRELFQKYVASKMFLSIQSKRSLDDIQQLAIEHFSAIKSGPIQVRPHQHDTIEQIFKTNFYEKMHFMRPIGNLKKLIISWYLDPVLPHYKCNPLGYLQYVFSNQGEGGLSSYLREEKFIVSSSLVLQSSDSNINSMFALLRLNFELTDLGHENIDKVLEAIFSYLLMIKETSIEEHRRLYNECNEKAELKFKFQKETNSQDNVSENSVAMNYYADKDILRTDKMYQEFDEKVITDMIEAVNQRKFNLLIVADKHERFDHKMKYYGIEYNEVDFPEAYQKLWDERQANSSFFLEKANRFIPTNFEIFVNEQESPVSIELSLMLHDVYSNLNNFQKYPVKIVDDDIFEVWHKLDAKFKMPFACIKSSILNPKLLKSSHK